MRIGVDVVSIPRIAHSLSISAEFAIRVFAPGERERALQLPEWRAHEFLAGRFAAKEAVLKAMRVGIDDAIALHDIEIVTADDGSPALRLSASAQRAAQALRLTEWQVSISHENDLAIAFVVAY
jgi:holo-[acyl-carrier protein] synthase